MIFDEYTTRLRALHQVDPTAPDPLMVAHLETKAIVDAAIADVDRLSALIDREVPIRRHLQSIADVAGGVRVSIELHRRPSEPAPRG